MSFGSRHPPHRFDEYYFGSIDNIGETVWRETTKNLRLYDLKEMYAKESKPCLSKFLSEINDKVIVKYKNRNIGNH